MSSDRPLLEGLVAAARNDLAAGAVRDWRREVGRSLFDALVCMAAGALRNDPLVPRGELGPALVVGTGLRVGLLGAVAANAVAAHRNDLDDVHWPSMTHPGSFIWPAVLASGALEKVPLSRLQEAAALGYQVCGRMAALLGPEHRLRFHVSTTAGTLGVAAAVSATRGLDDYLLVDAMLHACSTLGGTSQALRERSSTSLSHRAVAAVTGTLAALQATTSPPVAAPLTGEHGFCAATGTTLDVSTIDRPMDVVVSAVTVRRHPVTGFAHTLVDAILDAGPYPYGAVDSIEAQVSPLAMALTDPAEPTDASQAAWSLQHAAALAVLGRIERPVLHWPPDPDVVALRSRIHVREGSYGSSGLGAVGLVRLIDGEEKPFSREVPVGHPADPLSDEALVAKAVRHGVASKIDAADLLVQLCNPGDECPDAGIALLRAPASPAVR